MVGGWRRKGLAFRRQQQPANNPPTVPSTPTACLPACSGDNVLALKDPARPFPTGAPLGVLKWRLQTRDESVVPLTINCWPSVSGGESYVNIEYESTASFDLQNVHIMIPLPAQAQTPQVNQVGRRAGGRAGGRLLVWV